MSFKRIFALLLALLTVVSFTGCMLLEPNGAQSGIANETESIVDLPTSRPTEKPTAAPTEKPTAAPTEAPTAKPTEAPTAKPTEKPTAAPTEAPVSEDGIYDKKDDVALYLHLYGHLPSNYITKKKAQELGWTGGSLEPYAPGKCIGGDYFGNYEGQLPTKRGRTYHECDIGTLGKSSRGSKRIVYSNDGLIYYTGDHYESFTLLYGEE